MNEKQFEQAQALTEQITKAGIEQALHSHHEQPFICPVTGCRLCLGCDEVISAARLQANANAVRCVECQTYHDRRGR